MRERVERHRAERPSWITIEEPTDLAGALTYCPTDGFVIIDCLTLWVSNLILRGDTEADIIDSTYKTIAGISVRNAPTIVISNEVGLGIVPDNVLARQYRDALGRVNQQFAGAQRTVFPGFQRSTTTHGISSHDTRLAALIAYLPRPRSSSRDRAGACRYLAPCRSTA